MSSESNRTGRKAKYRSLLYRGIYVGLDQRNEAFHELNKALRQNDFYLLRLKVDPFMEPLQHNARFGELVKKMGVTR